MTKYLKLSFILIAGFFFSQGHAQRIIQLSPQETKNITNSSMWTVNATCVVQSESNNNKIRISVMKNRGSINGRNLSSGQGTTMKLQNNHSISVSAESGAQINLVNVGSQSVQAVCNT